MKTKTVTVRIDPQLKEAAEQHDLKLADVLRNAIKVELFKIKILNNRCPECGAKRGKKK